MKTTDSRDPLDRKIDELLASRPLTPSDDFAARVLAASDELPSSKAPAPSNSMGLLLRFALPIAALIAVALTLSQFIAIRPIAIETSEVAAVEPPTPEAIETPALTTIDTPTVAAVTTPTVEVATLSTVDMQEIFLLEEGLAALTQLNDDNLGSTDLLSTLDALYFEI